MATKLDLVFNAITAQAQAAVGSFLKTVNQGIATATASTQQATAATRTYGDTNATQLRRAGQEVGKLNSQWDQLLDTIKLGVGIDIGGKIVEAIRKIPNLIQRATERGVEFNRTIEDARLGIAAILLQFNSDQYGGLDEALKAADEALESLTVKAAKSPATLKALIASFQSITGAATAAGIPIKRQVDLVVMMSQALAGLGIRSDQIIQESRALLTGNITEDAQAARILGITKQQIDQAKEQGRLYEFLTDQMNAFVEAGDRGTENLTTRFGNLTDVLDQVFGRAVVRLFETLKRKTGELTAALDTPQVQEVLTRVADNLDKVIGLVATLAIEGVNHIGEITRAVEVLSAAVLILTFRLAAVKFAALFGGIATVTELGAAVSLTGSHIAAVISRASGFIKVVGWLQAIVDLIRIGTAGWKAWSAAQDEALSESSLEKANQTLAKTLLKVVEERAKSGALEAKRAEEIRELIQDTIDNQNFYGVNLTSDILRGQARELQVGGVDGGKAGKKLTQAEIDSARELALQKKQVALDVKKAELDRERELVEQSFNDQKLALEGYLARRRQLAVEAHNAELALIASREQQLKFQMLSESDPAKKAKLTGELVEIDGQKKQLAIKLERDLDAITRDGETRRKEIREKAADAQRELLNKISDDYREATFSKRELLDYEYNQQKQLIARTIKDEEDRNIALLQLHQTYLAKKAVMDAQDEAKAKERQLKAERDEIATERARIQNSYLLTNIQKRKQEIELLEREEKATRAIVEQLQEKARLAREAGNEAAAAAYEGQVGQYEDQARGLSTQRAGIEALADPESIRQQMRSVITEFQDQVGSLAQMLAGLFRDVIGGAVDGVAQGIEGLLRGTMNWGQALSHIGTTVLNAIISGFARMAAQWVIAQLIMLFASKAGQAASVAAAAPAAAAATALWTAPATLATIATFGGSAAAAPGLITASAGATAGLMAGFQGAASAGAVAGGGFKKGGYTGDGNPNDVAGFVHKGEFVIPAPVVNAIGLDRLQPLADGVAALGGLSLSSSRSSSAPINMRSAAPVVNVPEQVTKVVVVHSMQQVEELLKSSVGEKIVVQHIGKNKLNLGMQS